MKRTAGTQFIPRLCAVLALAGLGIGGVGAGSLVIQLHAVDPARGGNVRVALYSTRSGYLEEGHEVAALTIRISGENKLNGVFTDLPPGDYAAAALHDENGDNAMDRDFLGMPKEGYGFSGTSRPVLVPPAFDRARVSIGGRERKGVDIFMRYP